MQEESDTGSRPIPGFPPQRQPLDVLVSGVIRDIDEFKKTISYLLAERKTGSVEKIVFTSWKASAENHPEELKWCARNGITVVLSSEPVKTMMGNTWKQHKALLAGLPYVSKDRAILKTRSDKALHETKILLDEYHRVGLEAAQGDTLNYKLLCRKLSTSMMFNLSDTAFVVHASDFRRFLHCEGYYDVIAVPSTINAEIRMFSWPFVQDYRFVAEIFENFNIRRISAKLTETAGNNVPSYILAAYFSFFRLARKNFQLIDGLGARDDLSLASIWKTPPEGITSKAVLTDGFHLTISDDRYLTKIAAIDFVDDELKERTIEALEVVKMLPADADFLPHFDLEAMRQFDKTFPEIGRSIRIDPILWTQTD